MKNIFFNICKLIFLAVIIVSCEETEYSIPELKPGLKNDCIKHSLGPNVLGQNIEFAYAMALKPEEGILLKAEVEASIAGAEGTYLENKSYYTNGSGINVGVEVGEASVSSGNKTTVTFNKDTCAATLRYFYKVPEEARGKMITFKFSATANNGESVSYEMGPYKVREMDMILDLVATNEEACYISISDMAVYNAAEAAEKPDNIDLVYLYRAIPGISFNHALVSPSAESQYLPEVVLPSNVNNKSKVIKAWNVQDQQLARLHYGVFVDDSDIEQIDFSNAADFAINMKKESGLWVETEDGKYRAYIFINKVKVDDSSEEMTLSLKRLQVK
ncbi:DUF4466 domain-containing protein [Mariniphaga sediminis]|uniref:DUF4466 domain-containing protein n=1 Tax=Mariniphaga sediminis TaxID=1628158 RepID=A0A399CYR4_9BACT|nr:DUF4466 family protein [Mariniphaga sediminis]RIH63632.1 DUF4466 domain-containing protein [Mariniphaga sediminis]